MGTDVPDEIHGTSLPRVSRWPRFLQPVARANFLLTV